jgi:hypothetical protein
VKDEEHGRKSATLREQLLLTPRRFPRYETLASSFAKAPAYAKASADKSKDKLLKTI